MEKERIKRREEAKEYLQNRKKQESPNHHSMKSTLYKKMQKSWLMKQ